MKVIVDANIVFSGILNTNGKIGDLILNSEGYLEFISAKYMFYEVEKYYSKIQDITGKSLHDIQKIHLKISQKMKSISEDHIPTEIWEKSYQIMQDIDPKDTPYFAYSEFLNIKIWTGDKALTKGLLQKGYDTTVTTDFLYNYRERLFFEKRKPFSAK